MKRIRRPSKARRDGRTGAAAVEMALVSPIIFLMFLGAIELNNLNFIRNTAANAVYEGARTAIVSGGTAAGGSAAVMDYLTKVGVHHGATVNSSVTAQTVTVSVTIPMHLNSFGISRFTTGYNVTQAITLKRETPGEAE
ncbi:MAG TPA: hypothetical protein DDZ51_31040 [Planctomycetaceae bacterium]|nr:hypothetical protein [Planctomycetaceae bacterium]